MAFIESPRFPDSISYGSTGGPQYRTLIIEFPSGEEQRNIEWSQARHSFNAANGVKSQDEIDALIAFFHNARGRANGFRYKDWNDYKSGSIADMVTDTDQTQVDTAAQFQGQFQLIKTYTVGSSTYVREIKKPVIGTVLIKKNGGLLTEGVEYTVDYTQGVINTIVQVGDTFTAGFEFDVPCRFNIDQFIATLEAFQIAGVNLPLIEIRTPTASLEVGPVSLNASFAVHLHISDVAVLSGDEARISAKSAFHLMSEAWNFKSATYASKSTSVATEDTEAYGIDMSPDGTKLYMVGNSGNTVEEYILTTAFDIGTAGINHTFSISGETSAPRGITLKDDGTKFYIIENGADTIFEYDMTAYTLSTAAYNSESFVIPTGLGSPQTIRFRPDGTQFFFAAEGPDQILSYTMSIAWDITTATYDSKFFDFSSIDSTTRGFWFKPDGTRLFLCGDTGNKVYEFELTTPWDITTATHLASNDLDISGQDSSPWDVVIDAAGTKLYLLGRANNTVFQYTLPTEGNAKLNVTS